MRVPAHNPSIPGKFVTLFVENPTKVGFGVGSNRKLDPVDPRTSELLGESLAPEVDPKERRFQQFLEDKQNRGLRISQSQAAIPRYILIPRVVFPNNRPVIRKQRQAFIPHISTQHKAVLAEDTIQSLYYAALTKRLHAEDHTGPGFYLQEPGHGKENQRPWFVFQSQGREEDPAPKAGLVLPLINRKIDITDVLIHQGFKSDCDKDPAIEPRAFEPQKPLRTELLMPKLIKRTRELVAIPEEPCCHRFKETMARCCSKRSTILRGNKSRLLRPSDCPLPTHVSHPSGLNRHRTMTNVTRCAPKQSENRHLGFPDDQSESRFSLTQKSQTGVRVESRGGSPSKALAMYF
jgi:hypothetical protein